MRVVKAIREERNDVFEVWDVVKTINEVTDKVVKTDTKLEEVTVIDLEKKIVDLQVQKAEINKKLNKEQEKLALILAL